MNREVVFINKAMTKQLRQDVMQIALTAIEASKPVSAVKKAVESMQMCGDVYLISVGKAAWQMANTAVQSLKHPIKQGIVLTKYGHVEGNIPGVLCLEAGHPVPDENSFRGTQKIMDLTANLTPNDTVLFLLSGGGSALFEKPLISLEELQEVTQRMLSSGMDIVSMNTIRKRLSAVKGGRFAQWCAPAQIKTIILSDVLGDRLDTIASGPAAPDCSTSRWAMDIATQYNLLISPAVCECLERETPKQLRNVQNQIVGSVRQLCDAAMEKAKYLGYETVFLTDSLCCEASQAGREMACLLKQHANDGKKLAFIAGGETIVHVKGNGLGGRNQELALAAAIELAGVPNVALLSIGSDGTDGPTDAAGGCVDGNTYHDLREKGQSPEAYLTDNDAYHALQAVDCLIKTGPTGTNVNDLVVGLILP